MPTDSNVTNEPLTAPAPDGNLGLMESYAGQNLTLPGGEVAVVNLRGDGLYNIEGENTTHWGATPEIVKQLIDAGAKRLALEVAAASEEAHRLARQRAVESGTPFVVPTEVCTYAQHVSSIVIGIVEVGDVVYDDFVDWYSNVTGELLNGLESWVHIVADKKGWEPRIRSAYAPGMALPHPVIDAGTVGKGKKSEDGAPRFLLFYDKKLLENNYHAYFEGILRAGWRP